MLTIDLFATTYLSHYFALGKVRVFRYRVSQEESLL